MVNEEESSSSSWSWEQEKAFEDALATYPEDSDDRWEKIEAAVPGKSLEEIKHHYEILVEDINCIEAGRVPLPNYASSSEGSAEHGNGGGGGGAKKGGHSHGDSGHGGKGSRSDQERRKGIAWT